MHEENTYLRFARFTTSVLLGALLVQFAKSWSLEWDNFNPFDPFGTSARVCTMATAVLVLVESYIVQGVYHVTLGTKYHPAFLYFDLLVGAVFAAVAFMSDEAEYRIPAMMLWLLGLMIFRQGWAMFEAPGRWATVRQNLRAVLVPAIATLAVFALYAGNLRASSASKTLSFGWSQATLVVMLVYTAAARLLCVREET
jgi:hypothetical protein